MSAFRRASERRAHDATARRRAQKSRAAAQTRAAPECAPREEQRIGDRFDRLEFELPIPSVVSAADVRFAWVVSCGCVRGVANVYCTVLFSIVYVQRQRPKLWPLLLATLLLARRGAARHGLLVCAGNARCLLCTVLYTTVQEHSERATCCMMKWRCSAPSHCYAPVIPGACKLALAAALAPFL